MEQILSMIQIVANVAVIPLVTVLWKMNTQITRLETTMETLVREVERVRR